MRKAAMLYNPDSGGSSERRKKELESAVALLQAGGVDAELIPTESRDHAEDETRQAIQSGCDTIFACGGDGTVHSIAQVLATTQVQLAILPMGTANALAHDIRLPLTIMGAAKAALLGVPRRVAIGRLDYLDLESRPASRYFVVTAGVGVDAHLFYKLHAGTKRRMGMAAYYAKAWNLWLTYPMTWFTADYIETGSQEAKRAEVTELMGVRIRNFGGVLQELAPGASLERDDMRLVFCRTASRLAYLMYVTRGLLRLRWNILGIDLAYSAKVSCGYKVSAALAGAGSAQPRKIYVEADGELLGTLPAEISVVPDALTLLVPSG
jgi:diacylglycerol kinase family enzyme